MPAEIHKQVLDYQGGDANAALELVEKFKPLIKRYAFFLHREDSFEDLQRFLLSMLKTWDTLDVRTSMGDFSYYGMAIAPSGNGWGTYKTSAGRIENIQAAEHLARFLEDSQLLLWLAPSTFVAMESKSTLAADDTIYHAVSATILYLTAQGKIQPLVYQSGIPYYSQEVFEKVLLEMFGQHLDCTGLLQPVQIETHEEEAIPIKYPLAGAAYRVTLLSQQDSSSLYAGTPESAAAPSSEATVSLTYYLPSSAQVGEILFMPGERPYRISVQSNVSWEYLPFCFLGIEQET